MTDIDKRLKTITFQLWVLIALMIVMLVFVKKRSYQRYHSCRNGVILDCDTGKCYEQDGTKVR